MESEKKKSIKSSNQGHISVLDRLLNKPVDVVFPAEKQFKKWDLIVYKDKEKKEYLWEYLGYTTKTEKSGNFVRVLAWRELERFHENKIKADEIFKKFKIAFVKEFKDAKPISARMNLYWNQIYFYFFAEQRYDFSAFVKEFRENLNLRFFIYQVWARDRIRLHPNLDERYDSNWLPLMYHVFRHPLPQVNNDVVIQQWLRWRDVERLKDRSWKLDHTLAFEMDIYNEEIPKYPEKWTVIKFDNKSMKCSWYNILTQEIKLRWEDSEKKWLFTWEYMTITLDEYQKSKTTVNKPIATKSIAKKSIVKKERIVKGWQK